MFSSNLHKTYFSVFDPSLPPLETQAQTLIATHSIDEETQKKITCQELLKELIFTILLINLEKTSFVFDVSIPRMWAQNSSINSKGRTLKLRAVNSNAERLKPTNPDQ
ncbi:hypothetical protein C5167_043681 [Papaver somniferum]|uniref:Uncharacterized protein n=1 Tax=Papaver somniferum TaxID=3469 RepID=A0A4Y7LAA2_PAPSO|nr:hypothetical protein C5167_043681 [Papaver somniferum]